MKIVCFVFWLSVPAVVIAQQSNPAPALSFLSIEPDAKGSAIGLTGVATEPDNYSIFYNPAKSVISGQDYGLSLGYVPYLSKLIKGVGMASAQGFRRISVNSAIGLDLRFFSLGKIDMKDETGYTIYSYAPSEWTVGMSYSQKLTTYTSIGITARYINSRPAIGIEYRGAEVRSVSAIGADLGFYYSSVAAEEVENNSGGIFRVGVSLQNLGTKVKYHASGGAAFQPMLLRLGTSYCFANEERDHFFTISADINKQLVPPAPIKDDKGNIIAGRDPNTTSVPAAFLAGLTYLPATGVGLGIEYSYKQLLYIRGGLYNEPVKVSNRQFLTGGFGIKYGVFHIDMSYFNSLHAKSGLNYQAQTFKISLGVSFAQPNN